MTKEITLKDKLIMSQFPEGGIKEILIVGCGGGRIDYHLGKMGYKVYSTDYQDHDGWVKDFFMKEMEDWVDILDYYGNCDIFDTKTFPIEKGDVVICSEVLEHITDYKTAFKNLLVLTENVLIITFPFRHSFNVPGPPPRGHCNFWDDNGTGNYKTVKEFIEMASPYKITIQRGMTKKKDYRNSQRVYIITIDKRETNDGEVTIDDLSDEQMNW
jgi:hypothetical protein